MSIPLTASTETFTPECMAEIEGAPSFTFRHATVLDKSNFAIHLTAEKIKIHSDAAIQQTTIEELRRLFESEHLAQNITRLEAYYQAEAEFESAYWRHVDQVSAIMADAKDGEAPPELPPAPVLDFPPEDIPGIKLMIAQVNDVSDILSLMASQNLKYHIMHPRLLIRMLLVETTLEVPLKRRDGLILPEVCEEIIEALMDRASALGVDPNQAVTELFAKAKLAFALRKDEEKNSSSPRFGSTPPKSSASKQSTGLQTTPSTLSTDPATGDSDHGSNSPA